jgi:hypothetical protein
MALLVAAVLAFALGGTLPAHAGKSGDSFIGGPAQGSAELQFDNPTGVAVNDAAVDDGNPDADGDVYVVDEDNNRVQRINADGTFDLTWGSGVDGGAGFEVCVSSCVAGSADDEGRGGLDDPQGIDINQETGDVYVYDRDNQRLQVFTADGEFKFMVGGNVNGTAVGETAPEAQRNLCPRVGSPGDICQVGLSSTAPGEFASHLSRGGGVAVDPGRSHDVFVADMVNHRLLRFSSDGAFVAAIPLGDQNPFGGSRLEHVAIDAAGIVYVTNSSGGDTNIFRYDSVAKLSLPNIRDLQGLYSEHQPALSSAALEGLAIDHSTGHLLALVHGLPHSAILEFGDPGGLSPLVVALHMDNTGTDFSPTNLAAEPDGERYFVTASAGHRVLVLDDDGASPSPVARIDPPLDPSVHSITLSGGVDPLGTPFATSYRFEYSVDGVTWIPVDDLASLGNGVGEVAVGPVTVDGLEANTLYRVRVVASRSFGLQVWPSAELTAMTDAAPPEVATAAAQHRTATSAELLGRVNPNNLPTTYRFEYGRTMAYGKSVPLSDADAGSEGREHPIVETVDGLRADTEYHYRLVATNAQGTTYGEDRLFTTREEAIDPPLGRAYELVTPPDKNNRISGFGRDLTTGVPIPNPGIPAADGDGMMYVVNHGVLDPDAGTAFPHERDFVLIRRRAGGWSGESVTNIPSQVGAVGPQSTLGGLSADLETSTWRHDAYLFPSGSRWGTRVFDDHGGFQGSGWYDWIGAPALSASLTTQAGGDSSIVDDQGERMVRWMARGVLGQTAAEDLSNLQTAGTALYFQEPPGSGPRTLLNVCTGTGVDATRIPARDSAGTLATVTADLPSDLLDDTLGEQPCEAGSLTSLRGGVLGGGGHLGPFATAMSGDGDRIFFTSPDPTTSVDGKELVGGGWDGRARCADVTTDDVERVGPQTECPSQLYVRHKGTSSASVTRWVSRSEIPGQAAGLLGPAIFEGASADGGTVYFRTNSPLIASDPNGTGAAVPGGITSGIAATDSWDLYRYQLPTNPDEDPAEGALTRISGGPSGDEDPNTNPGGSDGAAARFISDDGRRAYFVTGAPIAAADNGGPEGGSTAPGGSVDSSATRNLYAYESDGSGGEWKFVARLPHSDNRALVAACATHNPVSGPTHHLGSPGRTVAREENNCIRGNPDGDVIAFETNGQLTPDDTDQAVDVYVYEAAAHRITRISAPPPASQPYVCDSRFDGTVMHRCNATFGSRGYVSSSLGDRVGLDGYRHQNVAADGAVYFETRLPLVKADTNGDHFDTYRWKHGGLSLISPGTTPDHAFFSGNSRDGDDVFFWTSQRIDPREIDEDDFDIYDARVGGGFPAPPDDELPCDSLSDACQGSGSGPAAIDVTTERPGGGNAGPSTRLRLTLQRLTATQRRLAARSGVISLRVRTSAPGTVKATARGRVGGRRVSLGSSSRRLARGGAATIKLPLSRVARRTLASSRALRLTLRVSVTGGMARTITIRLERRGKR